MMGNSRIYHTEPLCPVSDPSRLDGDDGVA
jgi:hypothetical protein